MRSTSAVSSIDRPPKKRSSTMRLCWGSGAQAFHGVIQSQQVDLAFFGDSDGFIERQLGRSRAAFGGIVAAGVINQDVPDGLRGDTEEMRAVFPAHIFLIDHA